MRSDLWSKQTPEAAHQWQKTGSHLSKLDARGRNKKSTGRSEQAL